MKQTEMSGYLKVITVGGGSFAVGFYILVSTPSTEGAFDRGSRTKRLQSNLLADQTERGSCIPVSDSVLGNL